MYLCPYIQRFPSLSHLSCARKKLVLFIRNKKIFQNFEDTEGFIKQLIENICDQKKISVEEVFYFYIFFVFLVLQHAVNLPLALKIVVCYVIKESAKFNPFPNH